MASVSFQTPFAGDAIDVLAAGSQQVTEGTAAPTTANGIEVRIDMASAWDKRKIREALMTIWRFLDSPLNSTSIPL